jgi:hypothetical protein
VELFPAPFAPKYLRYLPFWRDGSRRFPASSQNHLGSSEVIEDWEVIRLAGGTVEFWREETREYVSWNPTDRDDPDLSGTHVYGRRSRSSIRLPGRPKPGEPQGVGDEKVGRRLSTRRAGFPALPFWIPGQGGWEVENV